MFSSQELTSLLALYSQQDKATGLKMFRLNAVRVLKDENSTDLGRHWVAEIKGSRSGTVVVDLNIKRLEKNIQLLSSCSCGAQPTRCIHTAALIWRLLSDQRDEENWERKHGLDDPLLTQSDARQDRNIPPAVRQLLGSLGGSEHQHELAYRLILSQNDDLLLWRVRFAAEADASGTALAMPLSELGDSVHVSALDQRLDAMLQSLRRHNRGFLLEGPLVADVLLTALSGGRLFWGLEGQFLLTEGEDQSAQLVWEQRHENWGFSIEPMQTHDLLIRSSPPLLVDKINYKVHRLLLSQPQDVVAGLLQAPYQNERDLLASMTILRQRLAPWGLDVPQALAHTLELRAIRPYPTLRLACLKVKMGAQETTYPYALLEFIYGDYTVSALPPEQMTVIKRKDHRVLLERMRAVEQACLEKIIPLQPCNKILGWQCPEVLEHAMGLRQGRLQDWLPVLNFLPVLEQQGWKIEMDDSFPWGRRHIEVEQVRGQIHEIQDKSLFQMTLEVDVQGQKISLIPLLAETLSSLSPEHIQRVLQNETPSQEIFSVVHEGQLLCMPVERIRPLLAMLVDLFNRQSDLDLDAQGQLRLGRLDAAEFVARSGTLWEGGKHVQELATRLNDFTGLEAVQVPEILQAQLRPYQQAGLNWLQFLISYKLSGILADDMGLGKTIQTIAHIAVEKVNDRLHDPALIISPKSVVPNWIQEFRRFAPSLRILEIQGLKREDVFPLIPAHDVVITSYSLLTRDIEHLKGQTWSILVCDEAQQLKNHKTLSSRAIRHLKSAHTVALTGTPMENHLGELWSIFDLLMPGFLGNEAHFRRLVRYPVEKNGDITVSQNLSRRIRPLMLRRTKEQVARELPPKTEIIQRVQIRDSQRDLYEVVRASMDNRVRHIVAQKGLARSNIEIIEALLKLRQVCCDPRLVKSAGKSARNATSAKLEYLLEVLPSLLEDGRKVLIFSQFTSMLDLIGQALENLSLPYVELTGSTVDREKPVRQFQEGKVSLFLLSLKAGGVGLNLTAADTVFIYDPWWNPAAESQAADRAYRIGQDKPVFVYKLVCEGTVEEHVLAMQQRKAQLAKGVYGEQAELERAITAEDLEALFHPLSTLAE